MFSPSGEIEIRIPGTRFGQWRISVRGKLMAAGRGARGLASSVERLPDACRSFGFATAANEAQVLAAGWAWIPDAEIVTEPE